MKFILSIILGLVLILTCMGCSILNIGSHKSPELIGKINIPEGMDIKYENLYWKVNTIVKVKKEVLCKVPK